MTPSTITGVHTLLPQPVSVQATGDDVRLGPTVTFAGDPEYAATARLILAPVLEQASTVALPMVGSTIHAAQDATLPVEGYRLTVGAGGVVIAGGSVAAVGWAAQTLRQLLPIESWLPAAVPPDDGWPVPEVIIEDAPRFAWRGVLVDVARHFLPLPWLLHFVDLMAGQKHNVLHLHLADDEGWRMESPRYPDLVAAGAWRSDTAFPGQDPTGTPHGGYYTRDHLRALVRYAAQRGITVVPEIDFPGHAGAFLRAFPRFAAAPESFSTTVWREIRHPIDLSDEAVDVVLDIYRELLDVFPGSVVHIGGDEADRTLWRESPAAAELVTRRGLTGVDALQPWFTRTLVRWLTERGRIPAGWDEVLDGGGGEHLSSDFIVMAWRSVESGVAAAHAGHSVVMAPASATYLDRPQAPGERDVPKWGHLLTWQQVYGFDPVAGHSSEGAARVLGTQTQLWTEYLASPRAVEYAAFPRSSAHAEIAWTGPERNEAAFAVRLEAHLRRLDTMGVEVRPLTGPAPWQ